MGQSKAQVTMSDSTYKLLVSRILIEGETREVLLRKVLYLDSISFTKSLIISEYKISDSLKSIKINVASDSIKKLVKENSKLESKNKVLFIYSVVVSVFTALTLIF